MGPACRFVQNNFGATGVGAASKQSLVFLPLWSYPPFLNWYKYTHYPHILEVNQHIPLSTKNLNRLSHLLPSEFSLFFLEAIHIQEPLQRINLITNGR